VRGEGYKLISYDFSGRRWESGKRHRPPGVEEGYVLYDLQEDPGELLDVSATQPEQLKRMAAALEEYSRKLSGGSAVGDRGSVEGLSEESIERLRVLGYTE
jgi:hypothetical protein